MKTLIKAMTLLLVMTLALAAFSGCQGPPGPAGPQGTEGPQGPGGTNGVQGSQGPAGAQGPAGSQGPAGPAGAAGPQGPQGSAGPAGSQGPQGPAGPAGAATTAAASLVLVLSPNSGPVGSAVTVTGSGFAANTYGSVFFDINRNGTNDAGEPVQYLTTTAYSAFSATLIVPSAATSSYSILAAFGSSTAQASATFTITTAATIAGSITLTPNNGPAATTVAITGTGFISNISGNVFFDSNFNGAIDAGEPVQSVLTSATGTFSASLIVPSIAAGSYQIVAAFGGLMAQASATFILTASGTSGMSIILSPNFGPAGTAVTVIGSGFAANTSGSVFFDINGNGVANGDEPTMSVITSASGTFSVTLLVPDITASAYQILATVPAGRPAQASATFIVR